MIDRHGDDLYKYAAIKANFSSNVYTETCNYELIAHLQNTLPILSGNYPEPEPQTLERLIAEYHGVSADCVLVTNGATEAIYLVAHLFAGRAVSITEPTFCEYRYASRLYKSPIVEDATIHWLCNPNNPTGLVQLEELNGKECLIIDRSYEYFSQCTLPSLCLDNRHIYIYSLTKRYRIPGIRLGYILTSPSRANALRHLRQPWSVNALAIEAGIWLAERGFPDYIDRESLWQETRLLAERLKSIRGVKVYPSDTHFMLLETPMEAKMLKQALAEEHQILIRDASNFIGLTPYHIRIATQTRVQNYTLVRALQCLEHQPLKF